jgi:hypothetical protein
MVPKQSSSPGFLSIGNVISAGIRIYRDHFKAYFIEALRCYLWALVPVYGWAKLLAIQGMLGRLAFHEVIEQPESVPEARLHVKPRLWTFLLTAMLVGLIFLGFLIVPIVLAIVLPFLIGILGQANSALTGVLVLLTILMVLVFLFAYIWLYSRLAFVEVAIAVESINEPMKAISRSWQLSQGYVIKLQTIYFVAFLITLPTAIIGNLGTLLLGEESLMAPFVDLGLSILTGAFIAPFWQSIKAVIFYDLKVRKEGLDLLDTTPEDAPE